MQSLIRSKSAGVTGGRGTAGAGPGRDLLYIDDVSLGTNSQEDHILLLQEFLTVCQGNHLPIKLEKCGFMCEEMEYLGFDVGYGWCKPATSQIQPLQDLPICDNPKKVQDNFRSFIGSYNLYRRHIHNFRYSSAPLTDLKNRSNPWQWTYNEEAWFQELRKKISSTNFLGVPHPKGEKVLVTDACDVAGLVPYTSGRSLTLLSCVTASFKLQVSTAMVP